MNYLSHAGKVLRKEGRLPNNLIFFVTNRCNMKCEHCFYWEDLNVKTNDLTVDELDKLTRTMDPLLHVILTGGEPYLRADLDEIIGVFHRNTRCDIFTIPSNGQYADRMLDKIQTVLSRNPAVSLIQNVSFDGIGELHDTIRKSKGSYVKAVETVRQLKGLQKAFPKLSIGLIITFTSSNQSHFKEIVAELHSCMKPDSIFINMVRGNPKERVNENLDINLYQEAVAFRNGLFAEARMPGYTAIPLHRIPQAARTTVNELVHETYKTGKFQTYCYAGRLQGVLYPNGDVFPCELLDQRMGNVREADYDFGRVWFSERAQEIKGAIWDSKCFCTHECFLTTNVIFNPKFYPGLIRKALTGS